MVGKRFNLEDLNQQGECYNSRVFTNDRVYIYDYRYRTVRQRMTGPKVLEVGVGNADLTNWLSEDSTFEIVSLDGSQSVLDHAAQKISYPERVFFVHTYFEDFDSDTLFDDILITHSLEHVDYPVSILRRFKRFLKPKGRIHITVPNAMSIHRILGKEMGMLEREDSLNSYDIEVGHQRVYTTELLREHVFHAGLKVIDSAGIVFKPLSDSQMITLINTYGQEIIEGLFAVGCRLPELAAELYLCCVHKEGIL